jgi:outer membrane protein assembly factor BamB
MWGYASSPVLHEDRLALAVLHGYATDDPSYILAIDKRSGETLWRTVRPTDAIQEGPDSYATPQLLAWNGTTQVVMNGGDVVTGHDLASGAEIWRCGGLNPTGNPWQRTIASCAVVGDLIFVPTRERPLLCVRAGGVGDATKSHVLWETRWGPDVPSPVSDGRLLWLAHDSGRVACLEAETGEEVYPPQRLPAGTYSASPVLAAGRIYATNEMAETTVLEATGEWKVLTTNRLDDDYTLSSPALADGEVFIRTSRAIYCLAEGARERPS